ncbi:PTS sugar transporter subunit IIA [Amphibacillus sp. Q70]|uniref:PTS sugar transporter subunit IIA n=1 Tax=Amphibacillus sp. Q70 TaxID=3453416 RepID=UPI003F83A5F6
MFEIIIATHGPLASSLVKTLNFFFPDTQNVHPIAIDDKGIECFSEKINQLFLEVKDKDVLIFTDLLYGTPFNEAAKNINLIEGNSEILAGINLPALVEAVNFQKQDKDLIQSLPAIRDAAVLQSYSESIALLNGKEDDE